MRLRVGCEFTFESIGPTPSVWQVRARPDDEHRILSEELEVPAGASSTSYRDGYGNVCDRLVLGEGSNRVRYDATLEVKDTPDEVDPGTPQVPVEDLPDDTLLFLLPSRFCLSDVLHGRAWELFGDGPAGAAKVQAVCDWVHDHIEYAPGSTDPLTTAVQVVESGTGVCRDYAQVGVTFCRSLNIPARYVSGYLPNINASVPEDPMDFCSWFEAYLGGGWWTFDPRNNEPRVGRVVIGRGRDAADVAMVTSFGAPTLQAMKVWAEEA
ncbi:MAG TPA: transglutaminase family protein [Acidimicrobiales bacterium]|nr:transglutaminase family protein [Acidimicrobiales bacterium]